jgi:hypothetical protein
MEKRSKAIDRAISVIGVALGLIGIIVAFCINSNTEKLLGEIDHQTIVIGEQTGRIDQQTTVIGEQSVKIENQNIEILRLLNRHVINELGMVMNEGDASADLWLVSGVRKLGTTDNFQKGIELELGEIAEVQFYVRNSSGGNVRIKATADIYEAGGLRFIKGTVRVNDSINKDAVANDDIIESFNLGGYAPYDGVKGWVTVSYQVEVIKDFADSGIYSFHVNNKITGHDEDDNAITDTIMFDNHITVNFGD